MPMPSSLIVFWKRAFHFGPLSLYRRNRVSNIIALVEVYHTSQVLKFAAKMAFETNGLTGEAALGLSSKPLVLSTLIGR